MKKYTPLIIFLSIVIVITGLFIWGTSIKKDKSTTEPVLRMFQNTDIACLTNGHQNVAEHIHPELKITVDGEAEIVPANIGISPDCMPEIHTHDETGSIHAESFIPGRIANFNLNHFFIVWGKEIEREGFDLEIIQDGETKSSIEEVKLIDHSSTELRYTSKN